jgi:hypothetical protein
MKCSNMGGNHMPHASQREQPMRRKCAMAYLDVLLSGLQCTVVLSLQQCSRHAGFWF